MKDKDTLILEQLYLEMTTGNSRRNDLFSWLSPNGKFYPVPEYMEHSEYLPELGLKHERGYFYAFDKGYARIVTLSNNKSLVVNIEGENNNLTRLQKRSLIDLAIETGMSEVLLDRGKGYSVIWKANNLSGSDVVSEQLLVEHTFPNDLYHATYLDRLFKIIKDDQFLLSFANIDDGPNAAINEGRYFFLSMSWEKYGRYAHTGNPKITSEAHMPVTIVFDADMLKSAGKLIYVDYWESDDYNRNEKEIRFISDKQVLSPVKKYVKEIHVYLPEKNIKNMLSKENYSDITNGFSYLETSEVPVYYYNEPGAYKLHLKSKRKNLEDLIPENLYYRDRSDWELDILLKMIDGDMTKINKKHKWQLDRWLDYVKYPHPSAERDFKAGVSAALHNLKGNHPRGFQELVNKMKKYKLKNLDDLFQFLHEKHKPQ